MISHLHGRVDHLSPQAMVLDVGGVGFALSIPQTLSSSLSLGEQVRISTRLVVRQDQMTLFGFSSAQERELFGMLTSISGIGPKLALNVLSAMSAGEVASAVLEENVPALVRIPGIGKRMARRLIVELSEKIAGLVPAPLPAAEGEALESDAASVLRSLGCTEEEARKAVDTAREQIQGECTVERLVMEAMRTLG